MAVMVLSIPRLFGEPLQLRVFAVEVIHVGGFRDERNDWHQRDNICPSRFYTLYFHVRIGVVQSTTFDRDAWCINVVPFQ